MKAALVRRYGPPDVVEIGELPPPTAGRGQVLVRVRAASMNPLDAKLRSGALRPLLRLSFPAVLGFDFAGEIVGVGSDVTGWTPGERVYGRIDTRTGGTHAEFTTVAAEVIDRIPPRLSFEQAAALPLTAMTAIQALNQIGLQSGRRLLVNGAAGGVGTAAVQVGQARGAVVTGVCSERGAPIVAGLGAQVLDYTKSELTRETERFDVVFDTVFNYPSDDLKRVLNERGTYITTGFSPRFALRMMLSPLTSRQRFRFVVSRADGRLMQELSALVTSGKLIPVIGATYPLEEIANAHKHVESGHASGKVVVTIE